MVAVDPSSPITGGAVLGDRVRMGEHGAHRARVHPLARRRAATAAACRARRGAIVDLLDAAGFDTVIVETVGAGQSEVEIATLADTRVVVCPPGLGDDVQAIKAGILEIADMLVVSKGDLPQAERTERELQEMLHLRARASGLEGAGAAHRRRRRARAWRRWSTRCVSMRRRAWGAAS